MIGSSLIEVLVSMALLAVCLSAVFMTNSQGVREVRELRQSYFAQNSIENMIKRIQANATPSTLITYSVSGKNVTSQQTCKSNCSPQRVAARDLYVWTRSIVNEIDGAQYKIETTDSSVVISLLWPRISSDAAPVPSSCLFDGVDDDQLCLTLMGFFNGV